VTRKIPVLDLQPEIEAQWPELTAAIENVLRTGQFIMGPDVKAFEDEVGQYLGAKHAIGVNSGTDALVIGLRAAGIGPGDEVITSPFTFFATAESISQIGAVPVFVDIDPHTFNIDPDAAQKAVTAKTKAIIPVHLYGQAADMDAVMAIAREHGLKVIEDVAQGFGCDWNGKKGGAIGDVGAYSFFPSKNLGAFGDGGLITTNDDQIADVARMLRVHGARKKYYNETVGYNSRLDTIQAAVLRIRLRKIDEWNAGRRRAAHRYTAAFASIPGVTPPIEHGRGLHVYHQYTVRIAGGKRDAVQQALDAAGIGTMVYYPVPCHHLPLYKEGAPSLPQSEQAAAEALSLPIGPSLSDADVDRVVEALRAAVA
jgi:dTDP-4-amino-4,6-dideoxygalactose transaminase